MQPSRERRSRWTRWDAIAVVALTVLGGAMRLDGISHPGRFVFDEFYAADACLYVLGPQPLCQTTREVSFVHPPLAKWLIGAGIWLFGFNSAGWRVAPLVAGTLSVALLYILARRILDSTFAACLAAGLLTFDLLHFVMSRTAMLDSFVVFFGLALFLGLQLDRDRRPRQGHQDGSLIRRLVERRWLIGAGVAGGAAVASKWSGAYLLLGAAIVAMWSEAAGATGWQVRMKRLAVPFAALVLLPILVYSASFAVRVDPFASASWLQDFVVRHRQMVAHHTGELYVHPYMSSAWSWPLVKRPVLFHFREVAGGRYQEILVLGNPLVWWPSLVALAAIAWRAVRNRGVTARETLTIAGFLGSYLPWFVFTRKEAFLYYFLPAVPFIYLALADVVARLRSRLRWMATGILATVCIAMFVFFRPVLTATPLDRADWERRMVFTFCGPAPAGSERRPVIGAVPPPSGWCWI